MRTCAAMSPPPVPISVVVPTRDRPASLRRCLAALAAQTQPVEVVVVDDGSAEAAAVAELVAGVEGARLVRTGGRGPATARNAGARAAAGDVVCFLDDDCEPEPGWAGALSAVAIAGGGAAAGRTLAPAGADAATLASQAIIDQLQLDSLDPAEGTLGFAPSCNLACTAAVLAGLPFDEDFRLAGGEDREWSRRAGARGVPIRYEPLAVVVHRQEPGLRPYLRRQVRYGRGSVQYRAPVAEGRSPAAFYRRLLGRAARLGPAVVALLLVGQLVTALAAAGERLMRPARLDAP
jgi:glycosyltransferase involved in cell wall biosynthesis